MKFKIKSYLSSSSWVTLLLAVSCVFSISTTVLAVDENERARILKQIQDLENKKAKLQLETQKKVDSNKPIAQSSDVVMAKYEKILENCATTKNDRCADIMYSLGQLYTDKAKDDYSSARDAYEVAYKQWEKTQRGAEPVNPRPDYSKSLKMYSRLIYEYPSFVKNDEAFYQVANVYLLWGEVDSARKFWNKLIEKFPKSVRASAAHYRLSDFDVNDRDFLNALKHLEKIKDGELTIENAEGAQYRKAHCYDNLSEYDKAVDAYFVYIEKCDNGEYVKKELRDEALENIATTFSDMPNGAQEAINFFKRVGSRPYQSRVIYTVGLKNRLHGQTDDAVLALQAALKEFPYYKEAPTAQQALVECHVLKKNYELANAAREKLVDTYGVGSEWYNRNSGERAIIEKSTNEVRKALGNIALYFHALAQKNKDRSMYDKALKRYQEFFAKFPNAKWNMYEYKYNVASIYNEIGDYANAAEQYDYVARTDLASMPAYEREIDTLGMPPEEIEKQRKNVKQTLGFSQEDAGYNVIVSLDKGRQKSIAKGGLNDEQSFDLPETRKLLDYIHTFQKKFPQSTTSPEVLMIGANLYYNAKKFEGAINEYKFIAETYPTHKNGEQSIRMLANCYTGMGEFDLALQRYDELLKKYDSKSNDYAEVVELAAAALYKKAESIKKGGNNPGAAEIFKTISVRYPTSKTAERGYFDAAVCYEEAKNYEMAAATFLAFNDKFGTSKLSEKALVRAAEDFKSAGKNEDAAKTYYAVAKKNNTEKVAAPSLYNAGLFFEKAKKYQDAINAYSAIGQSFPNSEFAAEALFSVGMCFEKLGKNVEMATLFTDYAKKYGADKARQVEALVKAGDAYYNMNDFAAARTNYMFAVEVYDKFGKGGDIDVATVAKCNFKLGQMKYNEFESIKLIGSSAAQVKANLATKTKLLEETAKPFAKAIEVGIEEWTIKSTYMIGSCFLEFAVAQAQQTLFGNQDEKMANRIKIISGLEKYYTKAQEYFYKNIEWAYDQGITGEYVDKSTDKFSQMLYEKGRLLEEVGLLFKNSQVPRGLSKEDEQSYRELLEEKYLAAIDMALPKYAEGLKVAADLGIASNQWIDKIRARITEIDPSSQSLSIQAVARPVKERAKVADQKNVVVAGKTGAAASVSKVDESAGSNSQYDRNVRRIQNITMMNIPVDERIVKLRQIEREAQRQIMVEEDRIQELKSQVR